MARTIPTTEPSRVVSGDSWEWDRTLADFPPSGGWKLSYALRGPVDVDLSYGSAAGDSVNANGETYEVRVASTVTAALTAGTYRLVGRVTDDTDTFVVYDSALYVEANPADPVNEATQAEQDLAVVEAAIAGRLSADRQSYQINGRAIEHIAIQELYQIRNRLRAEVWRERNPGKLSPGVEVTFRAPT